MLVISRKTQECIRIEPAAGLDPSMTLREVFEDQPIVLTLVHIGHRRVRVSIDAPTPLKVWRGRPPENPVRRSGDTEAVSAIEPASEE